MHAHTHGERITNVSKSSFNQLFRSKHFNHHSVLLFWNLSSIGLFALSLLFFLSLFLHFHSISWVFFACRALNLFFIRKKNTKENETKKNDINTLIINKKKLFNKLTFFFKALKRTLTHTHTHLYKYTNLYNLGEWNKTQQRKQTLILVDRFKTVKYIKYKIV